MIADRKQNFWRGLAEGETIFITREVIVTSIATNEAPEGQAYVQAGGYAYCMPLAVAQKLRIGDPLQLGVIRTEES